MSTASRLEEVYRRFVLRDHVRFVERALRESGESGPVLDVGCGGGVFLRMPRGRGFSRLGLRLLLRAPRARRSPDPAPATGGNAAFHPLHARGRAGPSTILHL